MPYTITFKWIPNSQHEATLQDLYEDNSTCREHKHSTVRIFWGSSFPILLLPDAKSRLIGKDTDDGKDWRQEEKGTTEDEMVG